MRCFRARSHWYEAPPGKPEHWSLEDIRGLLDLAIEKGHFFVAPGFELEFEHKREEIPWEIFRGRLLEPNHTRVRKEFEAWNAYWIDSNGRSDEPILALKLDAPVGRIYVVRAIHSYVWEGYNAGGNVIESRETTRWFRELVGSIDLSDFNTGGELLDEINCLLFHAVVGTSRLPLTSLENPLPAFTLGKLAFFLRGQPGRNSGLMRSFGDLITKALAKELAQREKVKLLEEALRSCPAEQLSTASELVASRCRNIGQAAHEIPGLLQEVFNEVSLSPYTDFVGKVIAFVGLMESQGYWKADDRIDFLSRLLRKITRHLTAYDLRTFHHRGANYPDALLLDSALQAYLQAFESHPELFLPSPGDTESLELKKRRHRRALRLGWLLRIWYEDLPVPEIPTSPGENRWVLPEAHPRIPDELIFDPGKRTKRLFEKNQDDRRLHSNAADVLAQSFADLDHSEELEELGRAVFLDRPLGVSKIPGEPDQTPLLSYIAFSRFVAETRLRFLADKGLLKEEKRKALVEKLDGLSLPGVTPLSADRGIRPGVISISDASLAAPDFIINRTTKTSAAKFLRFFQFDQIMSEISPINWPGRLPKLIVQEPGSSASPQSNLTFYDANHVKRLQVSVDATSGYSCRAGVELPRPGLRLLRAWDAIGAPIQISNILIQAV
jgi:hypothetical protein